MTCCPATKFGKAAITNKETKAKKNSGEKKKVSIKEHGDHSVPGIVQIIPSHPILVFILCLLPFHSRTKRFKEKSSN